MKALCSSARLIALVSWLALAAQAADTRQPNVIMILTDDLGWSDAGFAGHPYAKTPNLDRFASESLWLRQFYVASPVCSPSRAAFLTGRFPARDSINGHFDTHAQNVLRDMPDWLDPKIPNLPRLLHNAGYATGVFGKWHLGGWHEGSENAPTPDAYGFDHVRTTHCRNPVWPAETLRAFWPQSSRILVDETVQFIKANKDRPFYAHLCLLLPHAPLNPTPEQVAVYKDLDPQADNPAFGKWMREYAAGAPDLKGQMATYLATITDIDTHVGRLLATLDEMGLAENTIILFTSDNGPEHYIVKEAVNAGMGDPGPYRGRKRSLYDGGIRSPALIRWPGRIAAGRVDDTSIVSAVDWMPTISKLAGAKLPADLQIDGEDVSDILLGRPHPRTKPLYWEWLFRAWGPESAAPHLAMREGDWKFYVNHDGSRPELYNVFQDNTEERNVAAQHPELVKDMTEKLRTWVKSLPPSRVRDQVSQTGKPYYAPEIFIKKAGNMQAGAAVPADWYVRSSFLLHLDYHPLEGEAVGQAADPDETARLLNLIKPDVIQMHAKGIPGWTTYPSEFGYTPPKLSRDVLQVWSDLARTQGYVFNIYYCLGIDEEIAKRRPEWIRQGADGKPLPGSFLCFSTDVGEQYLWPMIEEITNRYQPSGWWFDNVPAPVRNCYCERCRARFRREHNLEAPTAPTQEGWAAFKEMHRQIYREFRDKTVALVHRLDPGCHVAVNWDCSFRMPEEPPAGIDHFTGDHGSKVDELVPDAIWYDSQGKPFDLVTASFYTDRRGRYLKPRLQIEQEMGIILSRGGRYSLWDDPTREGGLMVDHCQFDAGVVTPFVRARQAWCHDSQFVPDISIYHGVAAHYAQGNGGAWAFPGRNEAVYAAIDGARRLHLSPELVSDRRLESGDIRSSLLLLENTAAMTDVNRAALRRYVEQGGRVLLTGEAVAASGLLPGAAVATSLQRRPLGRGEVLSLARPLFPVSTGDTKPREQAAAAILDQVIPREARQVVAEASPDIDLVLRKRGSERILHLVNGAAGRRERDPESYPFLNLHVTELPPAPACRVSVRLAERPGSVMLQPQAQPLTDWRWHDGWLEASLPSFESHQMLVIGPTAAGGALAVQ